MTNLSPDHSQLVLVAGGAAILMLVVLRIPILGALVRWSFSIALIGFLFVLLLQRAPFDPTLASLAGRLNLDGQEVVGQETRIRLASNGHFVARVRVNGIERPMMIDSGATITALSERTAAEAGLRPESGLVPIMLRTANGTIRARTATVDELRLGNIVARDLKVVVSPAFGDMDVIGMNLLSKLAGWRVEEGVLILVPHHPQPQA